MEFRALAALSNDAKYAEGVNICARAMVNALPKDDVVNDRFDPENGRYGSSVQTMGALTDSFAEHLLKVWLTSGKRYAKSILRPEVIESVYLMWKATGDEIYREWARDMWDGMEHVAMLPNGLLSSVDDVLATFPRHSGKLHSFVLAETLNYFYLIFKDGSRSARVGH